MADPFEYGVLDRKQHARLVADLENFALDAGIQKRFIYEPMMDMAPAVETYLRRFHHHADEGLAGLAFTSDFTLPATPERYLSAIAGFLVRNFVRARVMTLGSVIDACMDGQKPIYRALLIPNFFQSASQGGHVAQWQLSALYDYLIWRQTQGFQTILYISDLQALGKEYGTSFMDHLQESFSVLED